MKSIAWIAVVALCAAGCRGGSDNSAADQKTATAAPEEPVVDQAAQPGGEGTVAALEEGRMEDERSRFATEKGAPQPEPAPTDDAPGGGEGQAPTRSWFPETFLFEPLVVTDAAGKASVSVAVPDRLTTWRVLALAHSRAGAQAGAVTEFLGTLPAYVDPVVPPTLRAGDRVRLPIQIVNTTGESLSSSLRVSAIGAQVKAPPAALSLGARSSAVRYATLTASRPGEIKLSASLGDRDAVVRSIAAVPAGKPISAVRSGTLAAPRTLAIEGPSGATARDNARDNDRVRLQVFPGALAIVRSELGSAIGRGGVAGDAFALLLAGQAPSLLSRLGDKPDAEALREMSILGTQRIVRHARTLEISSATLLAEAALSHPDNPILAGIGKRAIAFLETNQLPDGTCGGADGWTLQRLLVGTAGCASAASESRRVKVRAAGAFERHAGHIKDPYTAAAILASGAPIGERLGVKLRERVRAAVVDGESGAKRIEVPAGVVRADGVAPSSVEATALAILGLKGDPKSAELRADLGAAVLASYAPGFGWGDGRANLACLRALVELFSEPIERAVTVRLSMDGEVVAEGELDPTRLRDVITLEAADVGAGGDHEWTVSAEPPLAGLGFRLEVTTWVPWPAPDRARGLEITAPPPASLAVGRAAEWPITVAAPAGEPIEVTAVPPAGVQIDREALERLVSSGAITGFELDDERLRLRSAPLSPSQSLVVPLRVIPTLAGSLSSGPISAEVAAVSVSLPPTRWEVQ